MLETSVCPLCGCDGRVAVISTRDYLHNMAGDYQVVRCTDCRLMRTDPRPPKAQIHQFYPSAEYAPYQLTKVDRNRSALSRLYWRFMDPKPLPRRAPGKLLEVGAAHGAFLAEKRDQGWSVTGYDFSSHQCQLAREHHAVQVSAVDLEQHQYSDRDVDVVAAWMVLEHLYDPLSFLKTMRAVVKPGGWLALSVPDAGSLVYRVFGEYCYGWQLPTHLYHFDRRSLQQLLYEAGWETTSVKYQYSASMWTSSLAIRRQHKPGALTKLCHFIASKTPKPLLAMLGLVLGLCGQSGKLTVWARRVD